MAITTPQHSVDDAALHSLTSSTTTLRTDWRDPRYQALR